MQVIYPPQKIALSDINIFLAGTIDMGNSIDWQQAVIDDLEANFAQKAIHIFNPRRKNWNNNWLQSIENEQFSE